MATARRDRWHTSWVLLAAAVLAQATVSVAEMGVPSLGPFIKHDFGLTAAGLGLVVSALNLGRIAGSLPAGKLVDRLPEPTVMLYGGLGLAGAMALAAAAPEALLFALALLAAGLFAGSAAPAGTKLVSSEFAVERHGLAMGVRQAAVPAGGLVAAAALPAIARHGSLHAAVLAAAAVSAAGALGAYAISRRNRRSRAEQKHSDAGPPSAAWRGRREMRYAIGWAVLFIGGQYTVVTYLVLDAVHTIGLTLAVGVTLLALAQIGGILGRVAWGYVSDVAFDGRRHSVLVLITLVGIASSLLLAGAPLYRAPLALAPIALLAGASLIGWQGVWMSLVAELVPPQATGTAVGYGLTFTNVAIVAWPPLFGAIADATGGFVAPWLFLAGALCASLALLARVREEGGAALG